MNHLKAILGKTFLSLRTRNFRLFFIGQTISNTGNWLTNVTLILLVLHITNSGAALGILAACQYGPILLLSVWAGAIADRFNKRNLLFITQSLEMAESFALAALACIHNPPVIAFYIVATVGGVLLAFDNPLRKSFVSEMVPKSDIPNAVVLYSTIVNISRIFGPALAGILVVTVGYAWCFIIDAISYVAVIACLWLMHTHELQTLLIKPKSKGEIRDSFRYVMSMPVLWISFIMLAVIGSLAYNFTITLPLFVTDSLHGSVQDFSFLYSVFGFGALISGFVIAHRGLVKLQHVILGAILLGITMLILSRAPNVGVADIIIFFVGMASILYMNSTTAIVQVESKTIFHGRVLALQSVLFIGTTPIGGPLLGWLADVLGGRSPLVLGSLACILAGIFGIIASRRFYREKLN